MNIFRCCVSTAISLLIASHLSACGGGDGDSQVWTPSGNAADVGNAADAGNAADWGNSSSAGDSGGSGSGNEVAPTPDPAPAITPPCGRLVFRDGFESGAFTVDRANVDANDHTWSGFGLDKPEKTNATIVRDPAGSEQFVGRFMVPDDGESFRAEIARSQFPWGRYRYAISHYIPSTFPRFKWETIITQWRGFGMPDANGKIVNFNPAIALSVDGLQPKWQVHMGRLASTNPPRSEVTRHPIDVPITYDKWNDWVFDITWSRRQPDGTLVAPGLLVVTLNGQEVFRSTEDNNYHQDWSPYLQMGIYRASWKAGPSRGASGGSPVVMYHKDLQVKDMAGCSLLPGPKS